MEDQENPGQESGNGGGLATLCRKGHCCQNQRVYCWPAHPIDGENFYFIGSGESDDCPYKSSYGSLYTCSCPMRKQIYKRYKI